MRVIAVAVVVLLILLYSCTLPNNKKDEGWTVEVEHSHLVRGLVCSRCWCRLAVNEY